MQKKAWRTFRGSAARLWSPWTAAQVFAPARERAWRVIYRDARAALAEPWCVAWQLIAPMLVRGGGSGTFSHGCTSAETSMSNQFEVRSVEEGEAPLFRDWNMWIIQRLREPIGLQIQSTNANFGLWISKTKYIIRTKRFSLRHRSLGDLFQGDIAPCSGPRRRSRDGG